MKTLFKSQKPWGIVENGYNERDDEIRLRENKKTTMRHYFVSNKLSMSLSSQR